MNNTLFDKVWDSHVVHKIKDGPDVLFIDRHMVHEVTSPVAFLGLKNRGIKVLFPEKTFATADHNTPTINQHLPVKDPLSANQLKALEQNSKEHGISYWGLGHEKNGIVHVVGPEYGITQPGATIVCGDSHTSTHGAFGCLAMGIGTSEVEHVLATQTLKISKLKNMNVVFNGSTMPGVTSKDIILYLIKKIGTAGGNGHAIEFSGNYIESISMEARMTICNMAIEAGAKVGLVASDETTIEYVKRHTFLDEQNLNNAIDYWHTLKSDADAVFDKEIVIDVSKIKPQVTWGTSPEMAIDYDELIPSNESKNLVLARDYMGIDDNQKLSDLKFDKVFIGSCTNSRIEDLRDAAKVIDGKKISTSIKEAIVVPGSGAVKSIAESEGLDIIFKEAGFIWRDPGCSMCLGMNPDQLEPYERCASTSNRNFEGRQGNLGRTHLMSPAMAAYVAVNGTVGDLS